jgi:hypothetical protein
MIHHLRLDNPHLTIVDTLIIEPFQFLNPTFFCHRGDIRKQATKR